MILTAKLVLFSLVWVAIAYLVNCIIAKKIKRVKLNRTASYVLTVATIGVFAEVFFDTIYVHINGHPLWVYRTLPVHDGYTSYYSLVIWGIYGFYLSMISETLRRRHRLGGVRLALIMGLETVALESAVTLSALLLVGQYIYYYDPGIIWHSTSLLCIPFYAFASLVINKVVRDFRFAPKFLAVMCMYFSVVLVFFV